MTGTPAHLSHCNERSRVRTHACPARARDDVTGPSHRRRRDRALTAGLGVGLSVIILAPFKRLSPEAGPVQRFLSANAFTVYVIHPAILVGLALALRDFSAPAIMKFGVLLLLAVPACWLIAATARRAPGVGKIM